MKKQFKLGILTLFFVGVVILCLILKKIYILEIGILTLYLYGWLNFIYSKKKPIGFIIFWMSLLFFNLNKIFFDLFGIEKWDKMTWWINYTYSEKAKWYTLIIVFLALYSILFGGIVGDNRKKIFYKIKITKLTKNISFVLFLYSTLIFFLKTLAELRVISKLGYVSIYTGTLDQINYPIWYTGNSILIKLSFYTLLINKMKKKTFLVYSIIYLMLYFISSFKGQRVFFISELLIIIYLYIKIYCIKINFKFYLKYIIIFIGILFFIFFMETFRGNGTLGNLKIIERLNDYSSNLDIITLYLDFQDKGLRELNYFFAPITDGINNILNYSIFKEGYSEMYLKYRQELSIQLSAFLNKSLYLKGYGLGGNYLADIYSTFGIIGIFIINFIIGFLLFRDYIFFRSKYLIILYIFFFKKLIYAPRASLLFLPHEVLLIWIYIFILDFIGRRKKNVKINNKEFMSKQKFNI